MLLHHFVNTVGMWDVKTHEEIDGANVRLVQQRGSHAYTYHPAIMAGAHGIFFFLFWLAWVRW